MKRILVCGAGGFIGSHLVRHLEGEGHWVRGVDLKYPEFAPTEADDLAIGDLREAGFCRQIVDRRFDEVYQLVADRRSAGYVFIGEHHAHIMHNHAMINPNVSTAYHNAQSANAALEIRHVPGLTGVSGRNSDIALIYEKLGWKPSEPLQRGLELTYAWIEQRVQQAIQAKKL